MNLTFEMVLIAFLSHALVFILGYKLSTKITKLCFTKIENRYSCDLCSKSITILVPRFCPTCQHVQVDLKDNPPPGEEK